MPQYLCRDSSYRCIHTMPKKAMLSPSVLAQFEVGKGPGQADRGTEGRSLSLLRRPFCRIATSGKRRLVVDLCLTDVIDGGMPGLRRRRAAQMLTQPLRWRWREGECCVLLATNFSEQRVALWSHVVLRRAVRAITCASGCVAALRTQPTGPAVFELHLPLSAVLR